MYITIPSRPDLLSLFPTCMYGMPRSPRSLTPLPPSQNANYTNYVNSQPVSVCLIAHHVYKVMQSHACRCAHVSWIIPKRLCRGRIKRKEKKKKAR